jgi:hypothetical protein
MPKDIIDYSNTIIYKIFCNDVNVTDSYIGHTTNFIKRKYQHKILCCSSKKLKIYDTIRKNGGWDNWTMVEIAKYDCKDATEARIREQEHYDVLKPSLNSVKPISNNEYYVSSIDNDIHNNGHNNGLENSIMHKFFCESCDYNTSRKCNFDKHLVSAKHIRMTKDDAGGQKVAKSSKIQQDFFCDCGRSYKHRQGLWKHKKDCQYIDDKNKELIEKSDSLTDKDLIMMLIKDNNELRKMMMEQQSLMIESNNKVLDICKNGTHNTTTHTNSHNKAFNLNFFLNETCKNAMNIMDFAESIQLQVSDLEKVGELGYIEGISNIIVKNLKALDVTERPIHCTDKKRETIYIKDEDKWEKEDDTKKKLRKVITKIARKNERLLPKYREKYPGCQFAESKHADEYNKIVIESLGGMGNNEAEKEDKIIRNIAKEVTIDKNYSV